MRKIGITGWALVFIFLCSAFNINLQRQKWQGETVISWDVQEYYAILPAALIYGDIGYRFVDSLPDKEKGHYWLHETPTGERIGRRSLGMAIMYLPFFTAAHLAAALTGAELNGFSPPYQFFIFISGFIYAFIGLLYLRKVLLRYFHERAAMLTLLCIALGTNYYYYTVHEGAMSHAPLFGLFSAFLYYTVRWHESPKRRYIVFLAITGGLSILIRPTAIIIFLLFFLYGVYNRETFTAMLQRFRKHSAHLLLLLALLILAGLPQLIYWKMQTGQWLYYTYRDEGFFFNDPKILEGLFSYRKGWLLYSPVMAISLVGFLWLKQYAKTLHAAMLLFTLLHIYIIFSWWCWWYGGSFGMRAMVETYALLALPMAAFWQKALKRNWTYIPALYVAVQAMVLNLQLTRLYSQGIMHWDSMSKAFYKAMLKENGYPVEGEKLLDPPDYEAAKKGER